MRVAYLADIRFPMERANGIQSVETCHALARAGVEVELVVRRSDERSDRECLAFYGLPPHPNLRLRRLGAPPPGSTRGRILFALKSLSVVRRGRFDVTYSRDLGLADLALRLSSWPVVYEAHTSSPLVSEETPHLYRTEKAPSRRKLERLKRRERRVCTQAARLVTITAELRNCLERLYGPLSPGEVIPDGARVPARLPPFPRTDEARRLRVYYIGQLYPWKGVDTLLEAMQELPDQELVIVGGLPPEPDLAHHQELAKKLGVAERVCFRGYLPPPQLDEERLRADIFVVPLHDSLMARHFTSPLKLFEAMAAGRPIVASDLPSIREVLEDGVHALLVPAGDPHALAAAIRKLDSDEDLRKRLAQAAGDKVRQYSWEERAQKIHRLLEEACG
jgi:glycosyltransferase involved in cell wall biosynthesis